MKKRILAMVITAMVALACGSSTDKDGGTGGGDCCPRGGASCAGGGSKRLNPQCSMSCDCLMITGSMMDADGCMVDVYTSTYPNCGGMAVKDSGTDSPGDAPADAPKDGG